MILALVYLLIGGGLLAAGVLADLEVKDRVVYLIFGVLSIIVGLLRLWAKR